MSGSGARHTGREFAIRVSTTDDLFAPFDARPVAERDLSEEARRYLLDLWEEVRETHPATLTVYAPDSEREKVDTHAVAVVLRSGFQAYTQPYHHAAPLSHWQRVAAWVGTIIFLGSIVVSTGLEKLTDAVIIVGISQAIVVVGWVALWAPAERAVVDAFPHRLARKRYAELTELEVRFAWMP
jgi:hypothetical protein